MRKNTRRSKTLGDLGSEIGIVSITSHFSRRSVSQSDLSDFCNTVKSENITKSNSRKSFDGQGIYEGSLINSKRNGFGKLITFDKKRIIYEGEWKNDKPDGFGTKRFPNGDQHHGHYLTGKRHGWGVYSYINGDKYTGDWSEGLMHGRGRFIWSTGSISTEYVLFPPFGTSFLVVKSILICYVIILFIHAGEFYEGKLENGTLTGEGSKTQIDGSEITGSFCNGKAHGYCVKKYACGDEYHGKYEFDQ